MIRRLGARVGLVGALAVAAAALPVKQAVLDEPVARARAHALAEADATARLLAELVKAGAAPAARCAAGALLVVEDGAGARALCEPAWAATWREGLAAAPPGPPRLRGEMVLVKLALDDGRRLGLAEPAPQVSAAVRRGRRTAGLLLALSLALVAGLGAAASALAKGAIGAVVAGVRDVVRGNERRLAGAGIDGDAIAELHTWLNALAEDAERKGALLVEQQKLLGALEGMTQGVVALDEGKVELMNQAARKMLDLSAPLVGEPLADHVDAPALAELLRSGKPGSIETVLPGKLRALARQSSKPGGRGMVLVLEDVSAIRHLETVRRDFVANVSHELRTPVAVIRANAETLLAGAKDDPVMAAKLVEGLHRNAERLARLIADLLDLSRLDAGQYRLELGTVSCAAAAEHALSAIGDRSHRVTVDVPASLAVRADRKALDQVLVNLLENAVRYTPEGTEVALLAARDGDWVRLEVRDRGPGIAPAHRARVFERFYRADPGRSREAGGTGLGLAIVKHLVESMHGDVRLLPNEPSGCVFIVRLPYVERAL